MWEPICNALQLKGPSDIDWEARGKESFYSLSCTAKQTSVLKEIGEQGLLLSWVLRNPELERTHGMEKGVVF